MTPSSHACTLPDRLAAKALDGTGGLPAAATSGETRENTVALGTGFPFQATRRSIILNASITCAGSAFGAPSIRKTDKAELTITASIIEIHARA